MIFILLFLFFGHVELFARTVADEMDLRTYINGCIPTVAEPDFDEHL